LTRRTGETGFGLLPTPTSRDEKNGGKQEDGRIKRKMQMGWAIELNDMATMGLLPTPTTRDANGIEHSPSQKNKSHLAADIGTMFQETHGKTSQLNPRFVLEMMGFPPDWTELPFQSGATNQSKQPEMP
jgi:hypothetical protein